MGRKSVREMDCCDQVDFCPFRGPDAPFALRRSYHEGRKAEHYGSVRKIFSPTLTPDSSIPKMTPQVQQSSFQQIILRRLWLRQSNPMLP
jgi:hypothetical protein